MGNKNGRLIEVKFENKEARVTISICLHTRVKKMLVALNITSKTLYFYPEVHYDIKAVKSRVLVSN